MIIKKALILLFVLTSVCSGFSQIERYKNLYSRGEINEKELAILIVGSEQITTQSEPNSLVSKYLQEQGYVTTRGLGKSTLNLLKGFGSWIVNNLIKSGEGNCNEEDFNCAKLIIEAKKYENEFNRA